MYKGAIIVNRKSRMGVSWSVLLPIQVSYFLHANFIVANKLIDLLIIFLPDFFFFSGMLDLKILGDVPQN